MTPPPAVAHRMAMSLRGLSGPIAAALLLLAPPALAEGPSAKPQPLGGIPQVRPYAAGPVSSVAALAEVPGPVCTIQHIPVFNAAMVEARTRLAAAVRLVRDTPDHPHIRQWFGNAPHQLVLGTLQRSATRLANTAGFDIHCNDPGRCRPEVGAYVQVLSHVLRDAQGRPAVTYRVDEGQVIGVCPPFFRARMDGTGTRWGMLVHEATHFAAETRDHVYGRNASLALARENGMRAAENADNYMFFVETLPRP
ncbi:M35 family metallo-endopeptidase [Roseomonas sp. CAU 1739]|uniref:M35 family metallopeptidase n=1 Tax=Roseomonas sp. CAU 1739 TaxID=3140364 RepID=UPI00325AE50D